MSNWLPQVSEVNATIYWAEDVEKIRKFATSVIEQLQKEFAVGGKNHLVGLRIDAANCERSIANIQSPLACGRIRLDYAAKT